MRMINYPNEQHLLLNVTQSYIFTYMLILDGYLLRRLPGVTKIPDPIIVPTIKDMPLGNPT